MNSFKFEDFEPKEESSDDFMTNYNHPNAEILCNDWICNTSEINHDCFNLFVNEQSSQKDISIINH